MHEKEETVVKMFSTEYFLQKVKPYFAELARFMEDPVESGKRIQGCEIMKAAETYIVGLTLGYFLYIPIILVYDVDINKRNFLVGILSQLVLVAAALHLGSRIVRGKGDWKATFAVYMYFLGLLIPFMIFINYPILIWAPITDFITDNFGSEIHENKIQRAPQWVQYYDACFATPVQATWVLLILVRWMAAAHQVTYKKMFAGIAAIFIPFAVVSGNIDSFNQTFCYYVSRVLDKL